MSTRFAHSAHHPTRSAAMAMPLAARQCKLLPILVLGLLASVVHPVLAHAQGMVRVDYPSAQVAVVQPAPQPATIQSPNAIQMQIQRQLQSQLDILGGTNKMGTLRVSVEAGPVDARVVNQPRDQISLMLPAANRLHSHVQVSVHCRLPYVWAAWVPATTQITGMYCVASRQLSPGKTLDLSSLEAHTGDLSTLPASVVQQPVDVVGHVLLTNVAANQSLRAESLRLPMAVQTGQTVKLITENGGFQVSSNGRALSQAAVGQVAQTCTANGNVVSGIAQSADVVTIQF